MKRIFFFLLVALALSACTHTEIKVVERHTFTLHEPDPAYLEDCKEEAPPRTKDYMGMSMDQREDALIRLSVAQSKNLAKCTLDKQSLRNSLIKNREIIQKQNDLEMERLDQELKKLGEKNG